jgi:hypothetical protein
MTDRDPPHYTSDRPRPTCQRRNGSGDPVRVAEKDATTGGPDGTESSYSPAASPTGRSTTRRNADDAPFEVRIEFVRLDGPEGQALRRHQAQIMRKVLQWVADHPDADSR